jgi:hypothetical protein
MKNSEFKTIGNCQCCGRSQAVVGGGLMSKHGYTVKGGWFEGVCSGDRYSPMQVSRTHTDEIVESVRAEVVTLKSNLVLMKSGKLKPTTASGGRKLVDGKFVEITVPFAEAESWEQRNAMQGMIYRTESRIRAGESFADMMEKLVNSVHGTALTQEKKAPKTVYISGGEQRTNDSGAVLVASYQEGARVYYKYTRPNGSVFSNWMSSRSWRALSLVGVEKV